MAQGPLVDRQIEDGGRLIRALASDGFGIVAAFWAEESGDGLWFLYIASPTVDERGKLASYQVVQEKIKEMPDLWVDSFDVKLIGESNPILKDAKRLRHISRPTSFGGDLFPGAAIERGYLYPPIPVGSAR
jgi:hypothetical protein